MTIRKLATAALTSAMLVGALVDGTAAASATADGPLPNAAYFVANLHYCNPPTIVLADTRSVPTGDAARVYEEVLIGTYGGNCDEFYANEVRPRVFLSDDQS
jgi:hypothetical protein